MRLFITTIFLIISLNGYCQMDTSKGKDLNKKEGYKEWSKYHTAIRIGAGINKSFFSELGVKRQKFYYNDLGYASKGFYTSLEWVPINSNYNEKNIFGLKGGYEITARIITIGVEGKFQTNFNKTDFIITPKIGLGFFANFFYGYNFSFYNSPFESISKHQFSLILNIEDILLKKK